jgi:uncharacterized protein (TIGR00369 family)
MAPELPFSSTGGYDDLYGLEILEVGEELAVGRVVVRPELLQPFGLVHGGVFASVAESLASIATAAAVIPAGSAAMGMSNSTSFLRPITKGTIHGRAIRRHRGRTTWMWDVEISDDEGRLCAVSRMTIAVRPLP